MAGAASEPPFLVNSLSLNEDDEGVGGRGCTPPKERGRARPVVRGVSIAKGASPTTRIKAFGKQLSGLGSRNRNPISSRAQELLSIDWLLSKEPYSRF